MAQISSITSIRINTVEFNSDNIDEMGKRPSFNIGLKQADNGTFTVVFSRKGPSLEVALSQSLKELRYQLTYFGDGMY